MRPWVATLLLWAGTGCQIGYAIDGNERFREAQFHFVQGVTTPIEVAQALGPPQLVRSRSGDLLYFYRLREEFLLAATLRYYGGNWLHGGLKSQTDGSLVVVFDGQDRLKYLAKYPDAGEGDQHFTIEQKDRSSEVVGHDSE